MKNGVDKNIQDQEYSGQPVFKLEAMEGVEYSGQPVFKLEAMEGVRIRPLVT